MVVSLGQRGRYTKSASGELDVRRRDLGPALAVVRVAHDLDPLPAELHAVVALLLAAHGVSFSKFARVAASEPVRKSTSLLGFRETIVLSLIHI